MDVGRMVRSMVGPSRYGRREVVDVGRPHRSHARNWKPQKPSRATCQHLANMSADDTLFVQAVLCHVVMCGSDEELTPHSSLTFVYSYE